MSCLKDSENFSAESVDIKKIKKTPNKLPVHTASKLTLEIKR